MINIFLKPDKTLETRKQKQHRRKTKTKAGNSKGKEQQTSKQTFASAKARRLHTKCHIGSTAIDDHVLACGARPS